MWVLDVESESMSLHLVQGEWTLGRSGNVFNFPKDKSISRSHAEFQVGGLEDLENVAELPSFVLIDKKSRFGTYLNDVQVNPNTPMPLRAGDKISFGAKSTILRVRYLKMVARTSRIQKANRKKLLEGCKAIGIHHVTAAVDDVNYCITDSGKFVATEKVLWAMVHNHPIVSSEWVQAVLRRKSMAEELPSCEAFLPQPDALSATEEKVLPSYSPDPRRFSLYSNFLVVFLTPSSMESLLPVMGGEVFPAYTSHESDEFLVDYLRKSSRDHVVIVYPSTSGDGGVASEKQQPSTHPTKQTSSFQSCSRQGRGATPCEWDSALLRRLQHFQAAHFALVLHQELAASIIFTKPPTTMSDETVSQLIGPTLHHQIVSESASVASVQAAANALDECANQSVEETPQPRPRRVLEIPTRQLAEPSPADVLQPSKSSLSTRQELGRHIRSMDPSVPIFQSLKPPRASDRIVLENQAPPASAETLDDSVAETRCSSKSLLKHSATGQQDKRHRANLHLAHATLPAHHDDPLSIESNSTRPPQRPEPPARPIAFDLPCHPSNDVDWRRKPLKRTFGEHRQAPVENPEETEVCIGAAVVVFEPLVVRRSSSQGTPAHHNEGIDITAHVRYLPRNTASLRPPPPSTAYNAKKFRKNHVVAMPVRRRLVTKFTNVVPVNLEHRREFARQDEELEARERLAEALFTSNMPGTNKTGSRSRR
ncbi:hypothetical protein H310_12751 [Aphanomyces invadans]|uniref:FHA domain-containing protein n=1 Tax=Aphanomyces invadans TaxID=157072 RepID=A0A024TIF8_9STRA|nr:hypothetical protein H310_12751 [Aphanomyces invadans]ETV93142.1 hypothetical protein H310_12751 [Aphanomyces invadans]|eukprot:XP_008878164.1 hypothetical protein H310_12751 [Aphanomyces invadans]